MKSIVPAFYVIEGPAEAADAVAAEFAQQFNARPGQDFGKQYARIFLCEASPTTEWEEGEVPHSLEGLTCDSGSDRSATGLIERIRNVCASRPAGATADANVVRHVHQLAEGWLQQRMAMRPKAPPPQAAKADEDILDAAGYVLHAYARAEANGAAVDLDELNRAWRQAQAEHPGRYESLLATYRGHGH